MTAGAPAASVGGRPLGPAPSARGDSALASVRARLGLVGLLFVVAGVAWWSTASRMAGMDGGPGTDLGSLPWFLGVWVVMMAAMMFPSVSPTVALYGLMTRRRGPSRPLLFASAYLVVWGAAGVVAYGVFEVGVRLVGGRLSWTGGGRWLAAGVLAIAAVYELTPLKSVCLAKCRSPLGFLLGSWRDGLRGAMSMGGRHAAWCLGCCWALMAAMFALGVMSLQWMAVIAGLIALEKTLPWRRAVVWATTLGLLGLATAVIVAPSSVPGLVVPSGMSDSGGMGTMP